MSTETDALLRALLLTTGRAAIPERQVYDLVKPTLKGAKQVKAFNLADGTRTQGDIAKKAKINRGNFSRTVSRWIAKGIMFRLGEGRDAKLPHIYPIQTKRPKE